MRLKSTCGQQDYIPSGFSRGGSFLCLFQIQEFSLKSFFFFFFGLKSESVSLSVMSNSL